MSTTWKMPPAPPPLPSPVASRRRNQSEPAAAEQEKGWQRHQPAIISAAIHSCLFLMLGLIGTGSLGQSGTAVQVPVIMQMSMGESEGQAFFVEDVGASALGSDSTSGGESTLGGESAADGGAGLPGADAAPVELLSGMVAVGDGGGGGSGDLDQAAGGFGLGSGGSKLGGSGSMPQARTSVFGIEGTGSRFVYVFDRSSSMNGYGGLPMANAKNELIKSLQSLGKVHQFQLIFYNEMPLAYGQLSGAAGMMSGTDENKKMAIGYVRRMLPDGGTVHLSALRMGLGMAPDVIFFLTDADEPGVSGREMEDLIDRAANSGTVIHTIQFGTESNPSGNSWMAQLAKATGGKYRYLDVTTFKP